MSEKPILFSGPMVRAILDGRKTVTRRVVRMPKVWESNPGALPGLVETREGPAWSWEGCAYQMHEWLPHRAFIKCPYGQPRDRLWVRETHQVELLGATGRGGVYDSHYAISYKADGAERELRYKGAHGTDPYLKASDRDSWRPSIHMPRWACRLTLYVVSVRVERLQEISDGDCEAEGVRPSVDGNGKDWLPDETGWRRTFRQLWDSINGKRSGCAWADSPWVLRVEFKRAGG